MSSVFETREIFCRHEPAKVPPIAARENYRETVVAKNVFISAQASIVQRAIGSDTVTLRARMHLLVVGINSFELRAPTVPSSVTLAPCAPHERHLAQQQSTDITPSHWCYSAPNASAPSARISVPLWRDSNKLSATVSRKKVGG